MLIAMWLLLFLTRANEQELFPSSFNLEAKNIINDGQKKANLSGLLHWKEHFSLFPLRISPPESS
jgi:hypothetical protein